MLLKAELVALLVCLLSAKTLAYIPPQDLYEDFFTSDVNTCKYEDMKRGGGFEETRLNCWRDQTQRIDFNCRYSVYNVDGCYCCGTVTLYVEHGEICDRYCNSKSKGSSGNGLPGIINLPSSWIPFREETSGEEKSTQNPSPIPPLPDFTGDYTSPTRQTKLEQTDSIAKQTSTTTHSPLWDRLKNSVSKSKVVFPDSVPTTASQSLSQRGSFLNYQTTSTQEYEYYKTSTEVTRLPSNTPFQDFSEQTTSRSIPTTTTSHNYLADLVNAKQGGSIKFPGTATTTEFSTTTTESFVLGFRVVNNKEIIQNF